MTSAYIVRSEMRIEPRTDISASRSWGGAARPATSGADGEARALSGGGAAMASGEATNGFGGPHAFLPLLARDRFRPVAKWACGAAEPQAEARSTSGRRRAS